MLVRILKSPKGGQYQKTIGLTGRVISTFQPGGKKEQLGVLFEELKNEASEKGLFYYHPSEVEILRERKSQMKNIDFNWEKYKIAQVTFRSPDPGVYYYAIHKDDISRCETFTTPVGVTNRDAIVNITDVLSFEAAKDLKWDIPDVELKGVFDEGDFLNRQEQRKKKEELKKEMDKRIEEIKAGEIYRIFAEKDPELKAMLKEFEDTEV